MSALFIIALALLPVVVLMIYIYRKDRNKEPKKLLAKGLFYGVVSAFLAMLIAFPLDLMGKVFIGNVPVIRSFYTSFACAGFPEEMAKLFMLWLLLKDNDSFDEYMDGIVYAVCIGLGFAGLENLLYVGSAAFIQGGNWITTGISRALLSVPGHYAFAVVMGFFYSLCHFAPEHYAKWKPCILIVPVFLHGIYDSLCFLSSELPDALSMFITFMLLIFVRCLHVVAYRRINALRQKDMDKEHLYLFRNKMKQFHINA